MQNMEPLQDKCDPCHAQGKLRLLESPKTEKQRR